MKIVKRLLALAGAALMLGSLALMTSCNKVKMQVNEPFEFPYPEHIELSWWYGYDTTYYGEAFTKIEDHPFMKRMEEATNVHVEFIPPTADSLHGMRDELEAMMAAGTVPDMVTQTFFDITLQGNTLDSAIEEEIYLGLNEFIDVQMPNFAALMEQYSIIDKVIRTPQDNILFIPNLTGVDTYMNQTQTSGLVIRKDFLDELQLDVPVTVADWENVLTQFKVQLGLDIPLSTGSMPYAATMGNEVFITCYDQTYDMYLDKETGKVSYGAIQDGMREYVITMNRWVSEGLAVISDPTNEEKAGDSIGAWVGNVDGIMNFKSQALNAEFQLVAAPDPVLEAGQKITYRGNYRPIGCETVGNVYLAWSCSQPAIAAKWLDQFFSDEKYMEASYGLEGEDYTVDAEGNVTFTEKITNNPDGVRYGIVQNAFLDSYWRDPNVIENYAYTPEAKAACEIWSQATLENSMVNSDILALTEEESDTLSTLSNFWMIQTGALKGFVQGTKDITEWDDYVSQMKDGGIDEHIAIYQAAYDRYLAG